MIDIIPGETCRRCGRPLWAVPMDVGYVERICMICDNRRGSLMLYLEPGHVYTAGSIQEITGMPYHSIMSELHQLESEGRVEIERHRGRQGCTAVRVIG